MDFVFAPVQTRRTFEEAVEQIAERIADGDLAVGDQLPSERALAEQMQISRPTVREALKVLAESGVLEVRPGASGGAFIRSDVVPREALRRRSDLRLGEVGGVLEARRLLEPQVALLAARHARRNDFEALERTIDRQRALIGARAGALAHEDRWLQLDQQFHLGLARATGNTTVVGLVRTVLRRLDIARDMALHEPPVFDWALRIHQETLDAVRSGEEDRILAVMDEHLRSLEDAWRRATRTER